MNNTSVTVNGLQERDDLDATADKLQIGNVKREDSLKN
jgi:hypothetical protein